jgi:hypothetical protein
MPYIRKAARDRVVQQLSIIPEDAGELNYVLTEVVRAYVNRHGMSYQHVNDCLGALEGCKLELYRRVAAPYEDKKIEENGDVYDVD